MCLLFLTAIIFVLVDLECDKEKAKTEEICGQYVETTTFKVTVEHQKWSVCWCARDCVCLIGSERSQSISASSMGE